MPLPQALCRCVRLTAQPQPGCSFVTTVGAALTGRPSPHAPPSGPRPRRPHAASPPPPPPAWASKDRSLGFRAAAGLPAWGPLSWTPAASQGQRRAHLWGLKTSDGPAVPAALLTSTCVSRIPLGGPSARHPWLPGPGLGRLARRRCLVSERRGVYIRLPTPLPFQEPCRCLQKRSLELCVSDHSVGVQGPGSSSIVRYVCTFQPSNLINGLWKNRESSPSERVYCFCSVLIWLVISQLMKRLTGRLVSKGTGQRLDSAREPGV